MADDNARAVPVFISGATGRNAANINGFFEPTEEKGLDGRVLYRKRGEAFMWMEHFEGQWHVKRDLDFVSPQPQAQKLGRCPSITLRRSKLVPAKRENIRCQNLECVSATHNLTASALSALTPWPYR